jgi:ketosteroid isomerase-like protein
VSEQNIERVRSLYRSAARGEIQSLRWIDERIAEEHQRVPEQPGIFKPEPIDDPRWQPERFYDLRDRVLVRVKLSGHTRDTEQKTETRLAHLWSIRRGEAIGLAIYHDWESGLAAAGVAE